MTNVRRARPAGHGSVMFNLRLARESGERASAAERERAMEKLVDSGRVPRGWKMAAIEWAHPSRGSARWVRGGEKDLDRFLPLLRDVGLSNLRMKRVETKPGREPTKREQAAIKRLVKAMTKRDVLRAKELRAVSRLKSKEARGRHAARASVWARAATPFRERLDRLRSVLEPEEEYEVAVDYRKRGRR